MAKSILREQAIALRRKGFSYSEILDQIPVARSTLSLWLRSVALAKQQKQRLSEKKRLAQMRGAETRHRQRIENTEEIIRQARIELGYFSKRDLWMFGVALYWAEGSKQKEWNPSASVQFSNSDPAMIQVFLRWLQEICNISLSHTRFSLFIHEKSNIQKTKDFWQGVVSRDINFVYFKRHNPSPRRRNLGETYHGVLRVTVREGTALNRKINGWIESISSQCGVV